jgi:hypothetical protein
LGEVGAFASIAMSASSPSFVFRGAANLAIVQPSSKLTTHIIAEKRFQTIF